MLLSLLACSVFLQISCIGKLVLMLAIGIGLFIYALGMPIKVLPWM